MHQLKPNELLALPGINPGNTIENSDGIECPNCKKVFCALPSTICWECEHAIGVAKAREDRLKTVFGGEKAAKEFTFERFEQTEGTLEAYQACRGFNPTSENLYLWGSCGTGKTHLAIASARENYLLHGKSVICLKTYQLTRRFRMKNPNEEESEIMRISNADILVIDDFGVEKITEFATSILYEIIDQRIMNYKNGMIITSNLKLSDLALKLADDRIPSRLNGICRRFELQGVDYRTKQTIH
jgi:DNA replication protein DnaC